MVGRNVADLVTTPKGREGRPSKALTLEQDIAVLAEARTHWLHAYVTLSLLTGVRTEEARALQWWHVVAWVNDVQQWRPVSEAGFVHDKLAVYVWRSVRAGGDTKTKKFRRTLEVPDEVAKALRQHHAKQAARRLRAGERWQDHDLAFCTRSGRPLVAGNIRRAFRTITKAAGVGKDRTQENYATPLSDPERQRRTHRKDYRPGWPQVDDRHANRVPASAPARHRDWATTMNTILNRQRTTERQ